MLSKCSKTQFSVWVSPVPKASPDSIVLLQMRIIGLPQSPQNLVLTSTTVQVTLISGYLSAPPLD